MSLNEEDLKLQQDLLELLEEQERQARYNKFARMFPDSGPYAREYYKKHVDFINAGSKYNQRALFGANRTGKTTVATYEVVCHLTGLYPSWWKGKRFLNAGNWWCVGQSNQQVREVMQEELLGPMHDIGSGMVPKHLLVGTPVQKPGVGGTMESFKVRHVSGDISEVVFKTCDQSNATFMGSKKQGIWFDEEPDRISLYTECLTRTMNKANPGVVICTFTPLKSMSDVVLSFLVDGKFPINGNIHPENPHKYIEKIMWDDLPPHLDEEQKKELMASYPEHEISARTRGEPGLGAGAVFPYQTDYIKVEPFAIPDWWPKAYGLDVGWNMTAAIWGAQDPDSGTIYLWSEHYLGEKEAPIHASAIKQRGEWIEGAIDSAATGAMQTDGTRLIDLYEQNGLNLIKADKRGVETDVARISQMFVTGQLKVFSTLNYFFTEYRLYRRNDKQEIIAKKNHLMDAMRYLLKHFDDIASMRPDVIEKNRREVSTGNSDSLTGY
jgi:phage terminase large subunit-like protein